MFRECLQSHNPRQFTISTRNPSYPMLCIPTCDYSATPVCRSGTLRRVTGGPKFQAIANDEQTSQGNSTAFLCPESVHAACMDTSQTNGKVASILEVF